MISSRRFLLTVCGLGACAGAVAGGESWLRGHGYGAPEDDRELVRFTTPILETYDHLALDPALFYTVLPDQRASSEHAGRYATGDWPYRGRPARPAPPELLRVAVIGDSCVSGSGVDAAAALPARIAAELDRRGLDPCSVQVTGFGVVGYSTVQLRNLLDDVLADYAPDAVVLYPAAWNDQAPASSPTSDVDLARSQHALLRRFLPATARWLASRRVDRQIEDARGAEASEHADGPSSPRPRVAEVSVIAEVESMLARCRKRGVPVLVVVPPHPAATLEDHPRTGRDADNVRATAVLRGFDVVDGPVLFARSGLPTAGLFLDDVHPTPVGYSLLAEVIGAELANLLRREGLPRADASVRILDVEPRSVPVLGDRVIRVTLSEWREAQPPLLLLGDAPLIDVRRVEGDATGATFEGTCIANAPGLAHLVVQGGRSCALLREAVLYVAPELFYDEPAGCVRVSSRPGDRVFLLVGAAPRPEPRWSPAGRTHLGDEARALEPDAGFVCGADGAVSIPLAALGDGAGPLALQAVAAPPGAGDPLRVGATTGVLLLDLAR